jgi:hypothetical protein
MRAGEDSPDQQRSPTAATNRLADRPAKPPCPSCGRSESDVKDSRPALREAGIRRKRKCVCGVVFFTLEVFERKAS